jgi:hypothetical protein
VRSKFEPVRLISLRQAGLWEYFLFYSSTFLLYFQAIFSALLKMKLIKQNIERKDGSGSATLLPEEPEDMVW